MVGAFETVQKVASIEATHCSKQPTICYNSKHCAFDHFISRRAGCSKSKNSKRHVPGRERQSKAEEWLCPTNCGFLWCPLRCLTTLMITLRVSLLCSPSPNRRKTSATFSSVFFSSQATFGTSPAFPVFPLWALLSLCVHAGTLPPLAQTGSVSWCLPYSLHMLSRRNGCLMICLHRSCRELFRFELRRRKGNERRRKKNK